MPTVSISSHLNDSYILLVYRFKYRQNYSTLQFPIHNKKQAIGNRYVITNSLAGDHAHLLGFSGRALLNIHFDFRALLEYRVGDMTSVGIAIFWQLLST
jgi:hypothetical protein